MKGTIYKITNKFNTKIYVGQTWKTAEQRFCRHCQEARWTKPKRMPIVSAIKKYGHRKFKVHILEEIEDCTQQKLDEREIFWVLKLNTFSPFGYNLRAGQARGILSDESKKKISLKNKGKKRSEETKKKLSAIHLGYKVKESTKKKLSLANKGKKLSAEHKRKISKGNKGKKRSESTKIKMRNKKLKYSYEIVSPEGLIFKTNNLRKFSVDNNLNPGHMGSVANGKKRHYKQWVVNKILGNALDASLIAG